MKYWKVKATEEPKASDLRRIDPKKTRKKFKRNRNIEASQQATREKIEQQEAQRGGMPSYLRSYLPEEESAQKAVEHTLRKIVCECGHRGAKHGMYNRSKYVSYGVAKRLHASCDICERDDDGRCKRLRPTNALWISACSAHRKFTKNCILCTKGSWALNDD